MTFYFLANALAWLCEEFANQPVERLHILRSANIIAKFSRTGLAARKMTHRLSEQCKRHGFAKLVPQHSKMPTDHFADLLASWFS